MLLRCPHEPPPMTSESAWCSQAPEGRSPTPAYGVTVVPRISFQCLTAQQVVLSHSQSSHGGRCRQHNVSRLSGIFHMGSTCSRLSRSVPSNVPVPGCEPRAHLWMFSPPGVSVWHFGQDQPLLSTCFCLIFTTADEIYCYRFLIRAKCDQTFALFL